MGYVRHEKLRLRGLRMGLNGHTGDRYGMLGQIAAQSEQYVWYNEVNKGMSCPNH